MKYYAIKVGNETGIFTSWEECQRHVSGYPNAVFKSFSNIHDAEAFLFEKENTEIYDTYAYTDGSYNAELDLCGYASILYYNDKKFLLSGTCANTYSLNNITGELKAVVETVGHCIGLGVKELTIYHDYIGIDMWATNKWKANNPITKRYQRYMNSIKNQITISFQKVRGHSGDEGNDEADKYAKEAFEIEREWEEI